MPRSATTDQQRLQQLLLSRTVSGALQWERARHQPSAVSGAYEAWTLPRGTLAQIGILAYPTRTVVDDSTVLRGRAARRVHRAAQNSCRARRIKLAEQRTRTAVSILERMTNA